MRTLIPEGPPKLCPACGFLRPRSDFYGTRHPNGRVYAQSLCIKHTKARVISGQEADPVRTRERRLRNRRNRRSNPEWRATNRVYQREWARRKRAIPAERWRVRTEASGHGGMDLDATPFIAWLRVQGDNSGAIAQATGMPDATVRALLRGARSTVRLDTVDAALIHANTLITLDDLYPLEEAA